MRVIAAPPHPSGRPFSSTPCERHPGTGSGAFLWILRHGQVREDFHEVAYGNMDVPLSARGEEQTRDLEQAFGGLPLARVASSHLARALALGRAVSKATGAELEITEDLREIDRGDWQGGTRAEFHSRWSAEAEAFHADPFHWSARGGESDEDVWRRVRPVLDRNLQAAVVDGVPQNVALTCHYNVMRVAVTRCLGWSPAESYAFRNDPGHFALLRDAPRGWELCCHDIASDPAGRIAASR